MSITCDLILKMPPLNSSIKLLGGKNGLNNQIRWTHVLESAEAIQFLQGNELTFMTCIQIGNDTNQLVSTIKKLSEKHVAGVVINTGKYILNVPHEVVDEANELDLPLFEIPWEVHLVDVTKLIATAIFESEKQEKSASFLLEKILLSDQNNYLDYLYIAEFYGYNLNGPLRIANIEFVNLLQYTEKLSEHVSLTTLQNQIEQLISYDLLKYSKKCLYMWKANNLIFVEPVDPDHEIEQVDSTVNFIQDEIEQRMSGLSMRIGLGGYYEGVDNLKKSYAEAQLALKLAMSSRGKTYVLYRNAGIYKFLNKLNDSKVMIDFYVETLGCILKYDKDNNTEFTETLRVYLEEGENTANTIQRLYIHRNTLQYRLHRIEEILKHSLKNSEELINLQIAFKIKKFLNFKGLTIPNQN